MLSLAQRGLSLLPLRYHKAGRQLSLNLLMLLPYNGTPQTDFIFKLNGS
jgi:hypothetical protein